MKDTIKEASIIFLLSILCILCFYSAYTGQYPQKEKQKDTIQTDTLQNDYCKAFYYSIKNQ